MRFDRSYLQLAFLSGLMLQAHAWAPTVTLTDGIVIGTQISLPTASSAVNQFLGIPFAQSPPERFSPPSPPKPWTSPLSAQAWKDSCIQQYDYPEASRELSMYLFDNPLGAIPVESEDCLYINVYAPASEPPPEGRAVMYWIYGGSLDSGTANMLVYNGSSFAAYQDVIIVSANYRINVFGFPNSPELPLAEQNLGFLDQRAALDWVQKNIGAFGGDPYKVTIFGESAGGLSVDVLLTSYPRNSTPPFRAAIMESGQSTYRPVAYGNSLADWYYLADALNCTNTPSNLTCLREANASDIINVLETADLYFYPVADNITLVSDPVARRLAGDVAFIPSLSGTNAQEGRVFVLGTTNLTVFLEDYFSGFPDLIPEIIAAYSTGDAPEAAQGVLTSAYDIAAQIFTEFYFQCVEAKFANISANAGMPTWRYYFNATFPNTQLYPGLLDYHASELWLVYGTYPIYNVTEQEFALSRFMQGAWAKFAKDPFGGPGWNAVGTASRFYGAAADQDVANLGSRLDVPSAGVTMIRQSEIDSRCYLYEPVYQAVIAAE